MTAQISMGNRKNKEIKISTLLQEEKFSAEGELIFHEDNKYSNENPYEYNQQNISVLPQSETIEPENELMADVDICTNNNDEESSIINN